MNNKTVSKIVGTVLAASRNLDHDQEDGVCSPYSSKLTGIFPIEVNILNHLDTCEYVHFYEDACEGGGYLLWTSFVICQRALISRILLILLSIFYMLYLLLFLGSATDDCLCTSISSIVDQLKISQNVAGVTFMAFGNGAADIFGVKHSSRVLTSLFYRCWWKLLQQNNQKLILLSVNYLVSSVF